MVTPKVCSEVGFTGIKIIVIQRFTPGYIAFVERA
jgi:hypothetical protein